MILVVNEQGIQKTAYQNFQFIHPLKITFMWTCRFYRYEYVCTYRRKEFQNIFENKNYGSYENYALGSCYLFTKKCVEHGIEHDIERAYGVCIH